MENWNNIADDEANSEEEEEEKKKDGGEVSSGRIQDDLEFYSKCKDSIDGNPFEEKDADEER